MRLLLTPYDPSWQTVSGEDGPSPHPIARDGQLLTLEQWHAVRHTWPETLRTGVTLPNTADVQDLRDDIRRLSLVVLHFPKWVDGRAYTQARLLRSRLRYTGEIQVRGEVLVDMLPLLQRCGVDTAVLRHDQSLDAAHEALAIFNPLRGGVGHYQGDTLQRLPRFARTASGAAALYAKATPGYEDRVAAALATLREAVAKHPGTVVQATSLGAEDMVLTDLIARYRLPISLATLDTGALHPETLALMAQVRQHYGLPLTVFRPRNDAVVHFVEQHGAEAMYQSLALRKSCCGLRKLEPLSRLLEGKTAWITGLRREQSDARGGVTALEPDEAGRVKINPLVDWSWADVWHYLQSHKVPTNVLHDQFMPSIGCAPCTRAIAVGEPFRAGRWWWEDETAKECGLHVKA